MNCGASDSGALGASGLGVGNADECITLFDLRTRWEWDPLRSDPRFQKILDGPEPKTVGK